MSLKEFLESNTVSTLGSTLPIPYMENITIDQEDSAHTLTIKTAFYIHVDGDTFSHDEGEDYEDFILNSAGLESYMVLAYDRSSKLESYGLIAGDEAEGSATYSSWPITGFSSIKNGSISPLKCVYRSSSGAATPAHKVVTLLNAPDINNLWMRATLLYLMYTNYDDASYMSGIDLPDGDYAGSLDSTPTFKISDDGNTIEGTMVGLDSISLLSDLSEEIDWWEGADLYAKILALAGNNSWASAINSMYAQIIDLSLIHI